MIDIGKIYCGRSSTGVGIGNMHPDQFWQDYAFGNIRERRCGDIWLDESEQLMHGLKHKADYIKGRCRHCQYRAMCTGSMRVRGYRTYGDFWAPEPQCYITDERIGLGAAKKLDLIENNEALPMPKELMA